ncbi:MAG TPA: PEGA domain-containing protein [Polyangiaceae bacterium]|nr:PEGA domain-containing protein [Polyangiaceae bacterium]
MLVLSGAARRWAVIPLVAVVSLALSATLAFAEPEAPAPSPPEQSPNPVDSRLSEARRHFELGIAHFDRKEWQAALVEFRDSRELAPTKGNTKNLAICLRKVGRFDEALDTFEALLREFPDLPPADRELARREISELSASVGTLEIRDAPPGARVSIDGVERGTTPLPGPVRLPAGTHTIRVVKEGSLPFEARIDLAGRHAEILRPRLATLTQAGRLRVSEKNGKRADVFVNGSRVGTAPWDGALAPGTHAVSLRGEGVLGTPLTRVAIEVGKEVRLELAAVPLSSELQVSAEPASAEILVDGVPAGRGSWKGRVASGPHRIGATLGGYAPFTEELTLETGQSRVVRAELEPLVGKARISLELDAGIPIGLLWGGDLDGGCEAPCESSLPFGVYVQAHATYRFGSGLGLGVHAGYLRMWKTLTNRSESHYVTGRPSPNAGTVDDHLRLGGLMAGGEGDYVMGSEWPLTLRVAAGALLGAVTDARTGVFEDSAGSSYEISATQYPRASYFYLGPEVRVGRRVGKHFEVSLGIKTLILAALGHPTWPGTEVIDAGDTDKGGVFAPADLTGDVMVALLPGVAARYAF